MVQVKVVVAPDFTPVVGVQLPTPAVPPICQVILESALLGAIPRLPTTVAVKVRVVLKVAVPTSARVIVGVSFAMVIVVGAVAVSAK